MKKVQLTGTAIDDSGCAKKNAAAKPAKDQERRDRLCENLVELIWLDLDFAHVHPKRWNVFISESVVMGKDHQMQSGFAFVDSHPHVTFELNEEFKTIHTMKPA